MPPERMCDLRADQRPSLSPSPPQGLAAVPQTDHRSNQTLAVVPKISSPVVSVVVDRSLTSISGKRVMRWPWEGRETSQGSGGRWSWEIGGEHEGRLLLDFTGDWATTGGVACRGISMEKSRSSNIRSSGRRFSSISICHCAPVKTASFFRVNFALVGPSNSKNLPETLANLFLRQRSSLTDGQRRLCRVSPRLLENTPERKVRQRATSAYDARWELFSSRHRRDQASGDCREWEPTVNGDVFSNWHSEEHRCWTRKTRSRSKNSFARVVLTKYAGSSPIESMFSSLDAVDRHISCTEKWSLSFSRENEKLGRCFYQRICRDGLWAKTFCVFLLDVIRTNDEMIEEWNDVETDSSSPSPRPTRTSTIERTNDEGEHRKTTI